MTRACSADPAAQRSQKQPPATGSSEKFAALPDQLCAPDHQRPGVAIAAHTASGLAATMRVLLTVKPLSVASTTSACAGAVTAGVIASAALIIIHRILPLP